MMTLFRLLALAALTTSQLFAQNYDIYTDDTLSMTSTYLQETVEINLHLPETQPFADEQTRYPITLVFDSQHDRSYPQIIRSIDMLTNETQVPEMIIIGIPFTMQNRLYLTSEQKSSGDSLSGIQRLEGFLFEELIPLLQQQYNGSTFISCIGHSRTGFLVNYLLYKRPKDLHLAIALSAFFNDDPLSIETYHAFLTNPDNFEHPVAYFATSGTTREEENYLTQYRQLNAMLEKSPATEDVTYRFTETSNANHISNYWVSVPLVLMEAFAAYNNLLDRWFFEKLKTEDKTLSAKDFEADLNAIGTKMGTTLNPSLTHIYSLASHFAYDQGDYQKAIEFIAMGFHYYPEFLEFYVEMIEFNKALENTSEVSRYKALFREKAMASSDLTEEEKAEVLDYLNED